MNDAVKPTVSDETLAQEFARLVAEYHGASEDDPTKPEAWNLLADFAVENGPAISAALAAQGQGPVADLEEAIRLAEVGEYLYNACAYSYGDGYTEPREYGIEWQWQQSKPDEFGQGQLLAASTRWHQEQASDGFVTEASKLRSALTVPAQPAAGVERFNPANGSPETADQMASIMLQHGTPIQQSQALTDAVLPAQPVGVPISEAQAIVVEAIKQMRAAHVACLDLTMRAEAFLRATHVADPQPPAEGGWKPIESLKPTNGMIVMGYGEYRERDGFSPAFMRWSATVGEWCVSGMLFYPTHWMPLPPAPANGG